MDNVKIYVFCITTSDNTIDFIQEEKHIYSLKYRDIAVIVCDINNNEKYASTQQIKICARFHERIVELVMTHATVLPMRLLTMLDGQKSALTMLEQHYDQFKANLTRLRGKAEFGLKVLWSAEKIKDQLPHFAVTPISPERNNSMGKNYLLGKFASYQKNKAFQAMATEQIAKIDVCFEGLFFEKTTHSLQTENLLLNAAYLVANNKRHLFVLAFHKLKDSLPEFKYQFSGPWPPYNFIIMEPEKSLNSELCSHMPLWS